MKSIVIYFSRAGNSYVNGALVDLKLGNTEIVANKIAEFTNSDIFKLEPIIEYPKDYSECIEEVKQDCLRDARPELKSYPKNLEEYDVIYLGYPDFWGTIPMVIFTLLEKYDFSGKTIKPFCTHEGSNIGDSEEKIKRICPKSKIKKGLAVLGGRVTTSDEIIKEWIKT